MAENHIFPFLWMRGEAEELLREEIGKIAECGIKAVCVEARPHDDFCGDGWWHDMDIVIDEAKKRDMKIWILDRQTFPDRICERTDQEEISGAEKVIYQLYDGGCVRQQSQTHTEHQPDAETDNRILGDRKTGQ